MYSAVSYAITVSTEVREFSNLMHYLVNRMNPADEIVVLVDESKGFSEDIEFFETDNIHYHYDKFGGHFGDWKNLLNSYCTKDWIFQLDADEIPSEELIQNIHKIVDQNLVECIAIPRENVVTGITAEDIRKWNWKITEFGINWPDYQWRLYKNVDRIRWQGKVHEKPTGFVSFATIPKDCTSYRIIHSKNIEKQRRQNEYYLTLR